MFMFDGFGINYHGSDDDVDAHFAEGFSREPKAMGDNKSIF